MDKILKLKNANKLNLTNSNKNNLENSLSKDESILFKISLEEYNDLFPEIIQLEKKEFFSSLEKYIKISLVPKNIIFPLSSFNKILKLIENNYYNPQKQYIDSLITTNKKSQRKQISIKNDNFYFSQHCPQTNELLHPCLEKIFIIDNGKYFYCKNCNKVYDNSSVLLYCQNCNTEYYTEITQKNKNEKKRLKPATWAKYHCNILMNDTMKCPNCNDILYLNRKNLLYCIKCFMTFNYFDIKWICSICNKEFISEPKEYNPHTFKVMRLAIKKTIFNGIEAKPNFVPCCNIPSSEIKTYKFTHKKECNGVLFEGILDNKKIVVCIKCHMLNYYENNLWTCPLCKNKFRLKDYQLYENYYKSCYFFHRNKNMIKQKFLYNYEEKNQNDESKNIDDNKNYKIRKYKSGNLFNMEEKNKKNLENHYLPNNQLLKSNLRINNMNSSNNINNSSSKTAKHHKIIKVNKERYDIPNQKQSMNFVYMSNLPIKSNQNRQLEDSYSNNNSNNKNNFSRMLSEEELLKYKSSSAFYKKRKNKIIRIQKNSNITNYKNNFLRNISVNSLRSFKLNHNKYEIINFNSDNYNIVKLIGEGAHGKIYEVEDKYKIDKSHYALKKIIATSQKEIDLFHKQYNFLFQLEKLNANLAYIYGIEMKKLDKTTYVMYVLMELAKTDWEKEISLKRVKKLYYRENELIIILRNLVFTLSQLQKNSISHRDIKPQNILIFDNNYKISDFGEAKECPNNTDDTIKQTIRGTELYMSPILFKSIKNKTKILTKYTTHNTYKSDVFSLGLCFLLAMTLQYESLYAIRELDNMKLIKRIINKYICGRYSIKFVNIILTMLELEEKQRPDFIELNEMVKKL